MANMKTTPVLLLVVAGILGCGGSAYAQFDVVVNGTDPKAPGPKCPGYTCKACEGFKPPWDPTSDFKGIEKIICKYKYDICSELRLQHRACRKAHSRMCAAVPKGRNAANCARAMSRDLSKLWKKECKEEHARLTDQHEELEEQLKKLKRMRDALTGGLSTSTCSGEEGSATGNAAAEGAQVADGDKKKGGWFGGDKKRKHRDQRSKAKYSEKLSAQLSTIKRRTTDYIPDDVDPSEVDKAMNVDFKGIDQSVEGIDHSIDVLEDMIEKLEDKIDELVAGCNAGVAKGGGGKDVSKLCEEAAAAARVYDRHEEKCAKKLADAISRQAQMEALVVESTRRMEVLDALQASMSYATEVWSDDNLTAPALAQLSTALTTANVTAETRKILTDVIVSEEALCKEVLPTIQLGLLGKGIRKEDVFCPTPVGTFIAGRDLPDWAPHFLVGVGIVLGLLSTTFLKLTPTIFATLTEHPILFVLLFVVVFAGRFA